MIRITEIYWKSAFMGSGSRPFAMYYVSGQLCLKVVLSGRKGLTTILKHYLHWWPTKAAGSQPALLETHRQKGTKWSSEAHSLSRHGISSVGAFPLVCFYTPRCRWLHSRHSPHSALTACRCFFLLLLWPEVSLLLLRPSRPSPEN